MNTAHAPCAGVHTANVSGFADEWLAEIGRTRQVVLVGAAVQPLPALLAGTDLIASLPDYAAEAMAASGQLFMEPFPFKTPTLDLSMVWLSHVDSDPPNAGCVRAGGIHERVTALFLWR
jgi:LysR family transcriptional activator of mexEF-oprN operon